MFPEDFLEKSHKKLLNESLEKLQGKFLKLFLEESLKKSLLEEFLKAFLEISGGVLGRIPIEINGAIL